MTDRMEGLMEQRVAVWVLINQRLIEEDRQRELRPVQMSCVEDVSARKPQK